ncbi:MAG TPA: SulP family inorganic anion transporter, partial [Actinomycetota bacterium]
PGPLVAVVGATAVVAALGLAERGVAVLGELPRGLPPLEVPDVGWADVRRLLGPAAAIALIAAADTLVSSRAFAARNGYRVSGNRDLLGLGAANVASGLSGGITTSASAARTAVAESVGSRSQVAGLTAAVLMALVLAFLTPALRNVPNAALGAVVTAAVLRLIDPASLRRLWRVRRVELAIAVAAFLGVVLIGVLEGVVVAMVLAAVGFLRRETRPADAVLVPLPGRVGYHDRARHPDAPLEPGVVVYRFDAPLFYANAERFRARVQDLAVRHGADWIVIDAAGIADVDATSLRMLGELDRELAADGATLVVADAVGHVKDMLARGGVAAQLGDGRVFDSIEQAVAARPSPASSPGDGPDGGSAGIRPE